MWWHTMGMTDNGIVRQCGMIDNREWYTMWWHTMGMLDNEKWHTLGMPNNGGDTTMEVGNAW